MNIKSIVFFTKVGDSFIHFMLNDAGAEREVIDVNLETGEATFYDSLGVIFARYNLEDAVTDKQLANMMDTAWRQEGFGTAVLGAFHLLLSSIGVPELDDDET